MRTPSAFLATICCLLVAVQAYARQIPQPAKSTDVPAAATGIEMYPEYAKVIGRMAYVWGWPLVNMRNRSAAITQAPEPGRLNGVLPVAPRGMVGMLADYIDPGQNFVTCPNQDVVYGQSFIQPCTLASHRLWTNFS